MTGDPIFFANRDALRAWLAENHATEPELHLGLLNAGIFLTPTGMGCVSTVMSESDVDAFIDAFRFVLRRDSKTSSNHALRSVIRHSRWIGGSRRKSGGRLRSVRSSTSHHCEASGASTKSASRRRKSTPSAGRFSGPIRRARRLG